MDADGTATVGADAPPHLTITLPDAGLGASRGPDGLSPTTYRRLMAGSPLPFARLDGDGAFVEVNRAFADLLGTTIPRLRSLALPDVTHPEDRPELDDAVEQLLGPTAPAVSVSLRLVSYLGDPVPALVHLSVVQDGAAVSVLAAVIDLSGQRDRLQSLAHAATHDPLTGLLNRAGLLARLQGLLSEGRTASLALLDLDRLKPINDVYGHAVGDRLLRRTGAALFAMTSPDGLAARLAGDEFVVIADTEDEVALGRFLTEQLDHLEVEVSPGVVVTPTASIGTSPVRSGMTPNQVLALADDSMYVVKRRRQEAMSAGSA